MNIFKEIRVIKLLVFHGYISLERGQVLIDSLILMSMTPSKGV